MNYNLTTPCGECPFLNKMKRGFSEERLNEFASGNFGCHKKCDLGEEGNFEPKEDTPHCAGALIYLEKRNKPHQMMRIAERLGMYDRTKLNMDADVR